MIKKNQNPLLIKQKVFSMFIDQVKTVGEFISKEGNSHKMEAPNIHNLYQVLQFQVLLFYQQMYKVIKLLYT